jgi:hypothetical protein
MKRRDLTIYSIPCPKCGKVRELKRAMRDRALRLGCVCKSCAALQRHVELKGPYILAPHDVRAIRTRHKAGESLRELADAYGVSHGCVWHVIHRSWGRI